MPAFNQLNTLVALLIACALLLVATPAFAKGPGGPPGQGGGKPNGPGGGGPRNELVLSSQMLLSTVSAGCKTAANSTSAVTAACSPSNSTSTDPKARQTAVCSTACGTSVEAYWAAVQTACGSEQIVSFKPMNSSSAAVNVTASQLAPAALLKRELECTKDASGNYCPSAGAGPRGGPKAKRDETESEEEIDYRHELLARHRGQGGPGGDRNNNGTRPSGTRPAVSGTRPPRSEKTPNGTRAPHSERTRLPHTESHTRRPASGTPIALQKRKPSGPGALASAVKSVKSAKSSCSESRKAKATDSLRLKETGSPRPKATGTQVSGRPPRATAGAPHRLSERAPKTNNGTAQPQFNATQCAECTTSALSVISTYESKYPAQSFFGNAFQGATSWTQVKASVQGSCTQAQQRISSRPAVMSNKTKMTRAGTVRVKATQTQRA